MGSSATSATTRRRPSPLSPYLSSECYILLGVGGVEWLKRVFPRLQREYERRAARQLIRNILVDDGKVVKAWIKWIKLMAQGKR